MSVVYQSRSDFHGAYQKAKICPCLGQEFGHTLVSYNRTPNACDNICFGAI